jgi:hypothetical protein
MSTPNMVLKTETRLLPCPLTDSELLAKGDALANCLRLIEEEKEAQEAEKSAMKERLAGFLLQLGKLRQEVQERREFRDVPVEIRVRSMLEATVAETRVDTGEVIRERFMDDDERQMKLPEVH